MEVGWRRGTEMGWRRGRMEWSCQRSISKLVSNNHGGNPDNGQSTSGLFAKIRTRAISWASKLQNFVMLSIMEAEFTAAMLAGTEIIWLHTLVDELGSPISKPSQLHIDNQSTFSVAKNQEHHGWMKHLDL